MFKGISVGAIVLVALALTGCANQHSIYRNHAFDGTPASGVMLVDAKQRGFVYSKGAGTDGQDAVRVCAEQAPDVFSVLSSSLSADSSFSGSGASPEATLKFASAIAEAGSTIHRTQTVNLLAQSMYRTCERYLSGAIGEEELRTEARRDQHAMVAVLAIEQLTTLAAPSPVSGAVQAMASASVVAGSMTELDDAKTKADTSAAASTKAKKAYADALVPAKDPGAGKDKTCDSIDDTTEKAICTDAKALASIVAATATRDEAHYQALLKIAGASTGANSGAPAKDALSSAHPASSADLHALAKVSDTVLALAYLAIHQEELDHACIKGEIICQENLRASDPIQSRDAAGTGTVQAVGVTPLSGNVFIQAPLRFRTSTADAGKIEALIAQFKAKFASPVRIFSPEFVNQSASSSEIRYYYKSDQAIARAVSSALKGVLKAAPACQLIKDPEIASKAKPGLVEVWVGENETVNLLSPVIDVTGDGGLGCK